MKAICPYSGIIYTTQAFSFSSLKTVAPHPAFSASIEQLRSLLPDYAAGSMSDTDKRLLFLALLKRTELVEFKHPASPNNATIAANIIPLLNTLEWGNRTSPIFKTPRFSITKENCHINNIRHWINAWHESKFSYYNGQQAIQHRDALKLREDALWKLINDGLRRTSDYARQLGKWAIDSTFTEKEEKITVTYKDIKTKKTVTTSLREYWIMLFTLKDNLDILNTHTPDLEEMYHFFEEAFADNLTAVPLTILRHVSDILTKNKRGWDQYFGMTDEPGEEELTAVMEGKTVFTVVSTMNTAAEAAAKMQKMIDETPAGEPFPHQFSSRIEYLQAHARWILKKRATS